MLLNSIQRQGWPVIAILTIAFALRIATIRFGLPALNDPDELMFEIGALRMLRGPTLDPGWFGHPATTTMYLLAIINAGVFALALLTGRATTPKSFGDMVYADPSWIILPGRAAMVAFALGTVWLTWRLTDRLFGRQTAVTATLILAVNPVHITWSQVIRSDMMACLFMLLCLNACVTIAEKGRETNYRKAAIWLGLAIATKWPFALSGLAIAGATFQARKVGVMPTHVATVNLLKSGFITLATLFIVSPFLLIDHSTVFENLRGEGQTRHLGATGGSLLYDAIWYLNGPLYAGFGVVGLALCAFGAIHLSRRPVALSILAPVVIGFIAVLCTQSLVWERWALPLMPLGAALAAWGLTSFSTQTRRLRSQFIRLAPIAVLFAVIVPLGVRAWHDDHERWDDARQRASVWARKHIPSGSRVIVEHYAFDLVSEPWKLLFPIGDAGCVDAIALLHGRTNYAAIDRARAGRSNVDYGTMAPNRRAACHADFAILAQYDRYRQERDHFPAEYAAYQWLIAQGRIAATFKTVPGRVGGYSVTIVDLRKPKV